MADISSNLPAVPNYASLQVPADPVGAFMKSQELQSQIDLQKAQTQQAAAQATIQGIQAQRLLAYPGMLRQALANPTAANFAALSTMFPDQHQALTEGWNTIHTAQQQAEIDQGSRAFAALSNNRPDVALNIAQQHLDALQNSNGDPSNPLFQKQLSDAQSLVQLIQSDPKAAQGHLGAVLSSAMGPQDFAQHFSSLMTEPSTIGKAQAEEAKAQGEAVTTQAKAAVAPAQAAADLEQTRTNVANVQNQMQQRVASFGLDQQKFQTDTNLRMQELRWKQMVPNLAAGMAEQQATAVAQSQQLQQSADRAAGVAGQVAGLVQSGQWGPTGAVGNARMALQDLLGSQDAVNDLKKEYASVRTSQIFSTIQVGRTTDRDASMIQKGFPEESASPEQLQAWLTAYANIQRRMAVYNDAKADWISAAGSMGKLPRDGNVLGVQVPAGTSFNEFMARGLKGAQPNVTAPTAAPGTMPRYMMYGQ